MRSAEGEQPLNFIATPWPDYVTDVGLTPADIPELIRMVVDPTFNELDSEGTEVWAPIHAMRALGQLQATEAIAPLLPVMTWDDDFAPANLVAVMGMMGAAAIAPLMDFIHDSQQGEWAKATAVRAIAAIPTYHPDLREACVPY